MKRKHILFCMSLGLCLFMGFSSPKTAQAEIINESRLPDCVFLNFCDTVNLASDKVKTLADRYQISLMNEKINTLKGYSDLSDSVCGLHITGGDLGNRIYVSTDTKKPINMILLHELGHALDTWTKEDEANSTDRKYYRAGHLGKYSDSETFKKLFETDCQTRELLKAQDELFYSKEYKECFAEAYCLYVLYPEFRDKAPRLYRYFDEINKQPLGSLVGSRSEEISLEFLEKSEEELQAEIENCIQQEDGSERDCVTKEEHTNHQ